ncbi:MAG TPA: tripartite tricarboxylate transporter substrate binding protein [Xanthobacteraceae bacterium]|nr:tripartite tricarboxylate transporter substrate binding protein [Xanthobacteraceae bacterium]
MKRAFLLLTASLVASAALAQDKYPSRPIKVLVPYAPGGAVDIVTRIVTEQMRQTLGQPFVIENKPGAYGILAIQDMARARPDGYTLMFGNNNSNVITPILYAKKFTIDYDRDVIPVARVADVPAFLIVTRRDFPATSFAAFIAYAKQNPGKLRFSSVGVGSFPQFDMEILSRRAGIEMTHLPNKNGATGMLNDLVRGDAQVGFLNLATAGPMVRAGQLQALAVVTDKRLPEYPDVPTLAELGYPGVGTLQWLALFAPSGVPADVIETLHKTAVAAAASPTVVDKLEAQVMRVAPSASTAEAKTWLAGEMARWRKIIAEVKIEMPD